MIPIFKTQYSIGKSLLKPEDIVDIYKESDLDMVYIVEDSFCGFRATEKIMRENKVPFAFGLRFDIVQNKDDSDLKPSKITFIAKNNKGIEKLRDLYTEAYTNESGYLSLIDYSPNDLEDLQMVIPFYDSFICKNIFHFGLSILNLHGYDPIYLEEDNTHPFDFQIKLAMINFGIKNPIKVKSIYYKSKEDFHAFQMLKSVCLRSQGRPPNFQNPMLNHFCSEEFSWESYLKQKNEK